MLVDSSGIRLIFSPVARQAWFVIYLRRTDKIRKITEAEHNHLHTISLASSREVYSNRAEESSFGVCPSLDNTLEEVRVTDGLILEAICQLLISCTTLQDNLPQALELTSANLGLASVAVVNAPLSAVPSPNWKGTVSCTPALQSKSCTLPSALNLKGWKKWPEKLMRGPPAAIKSQLFGTNGRKRSTCTDEL